MERRVGFAVGILLVLRGLVLVAHPRLLSGLWEIRLRRYYPKSVNQMFGEFFRLSDVTIRVIGLWVAALGGFVVWLASKLKSEPEASL